MKRLKVGADLLNRLNCGEYYGLYRYFTATDANFGVLTNGLQYHFYSDLDKPNRMDTTPFMHFDLLKDSSEKVAELLQIFTKSAFNQTLALAFAKKMKYNTAIKQIFYQQIEQPTDEFITFVLGIVYEGAKTQKVKAFFADVIRDAYREFIAECNTKNLKPENGQKIKKEVITPPPPKDWISLEKCIPNSENLPITVRYWNKDEREVKHWLDLARIIAELLYKDKLLTPNDLPYYHGKGTCFIINTKPEFIDGSPFKHRRPHPLPNTEIFMFISADPASVKRHSTRLLKRFGKNPETDVCIKIK